jgi:DNA-binding IclR family transcriptional regulator
LTACSFIEAFVPNLAATVIGVAGGVPIALWLNRKALAHQDAVKRSESRERLRQALEGLAGAADEDMKLLTFARDMMAAGGLVTGLSINLSTWEVVRADVIANLPSLQVRLRLARFFEELALFGQHLERAVSLSYSADGGSRVLESRRQSDLWVPLRPFAERLISDLERIQKDLAAERAKFVP